MSMFTPQGFRTEGTFSPSSLHGGDHPIHTVGATLKASLQLPRGALVYLKAGETQYQQYDGGTPATGSLFGILVEDEDTTTATGTGAAKSVMVYISGDFNANAITIASGSLETVRAALASQALYLLNPVAA